MTQNFRIHSLLHAQRETMYRLQSPDGLGRGHFALLYLKLNQLKYQLIFIIYLCLRVLFKGCKARVKVTITKSLLLSIIILNLPKGQIVVYLRRPPRCPQVSRRPDVWRVSLTAPRYCPISSPHLSRFHVISILDKVRTQEKDGDLHSA